MRVKDIVIIGLMGAILLALQVALSFIPNIELVSLLIILCTLIFQKKTVFIITIFVTLEGLLYGFGLWWINYLYIWFILYMIVTVLKKSKSPLFWALISGFFGLSYGGLCAIPYLFIGGVPTAIAYWISGIPFDLIHGIGNFIVALVLFAPLYHLLQTLYYKEDSIIDK